MQLASAPSLDGSVLLCKALSSCTPEPASLCGLERERGGPCELFKIFNLLNNNPGQGATFCCMLSWQQVLIVLREAQVKLNATKSKYPPGAPSPTAEAQSMPPY